jgi:hypothetical protein
VPVPGARWSVSFESPPLQRDAIGPSAGNLLFRGSADRMIVSLHVGPPNCPGGSSNQDMYRCVAARLAGLKGVVQDSIKAADTPKGVELGYLMRVQNGERTVELFNVHLLFAKQGSWGDLHVSVLQPQAGDVPVVKGIVASVSVSP